MQDIKATLTGISRKSDAAIDASSHHYLVLSQLNRWMENVAAPFARGALLDYGCGGQPYREMFSTYITSYIGADVAAADGVDLDIELSPQTNIPLEAESIDTVLSTQTLEHVYDFLHYLSECHRVLKPAGRLIITVPMQWRMHEPPFDYWRFTRFGIQQAITDSGFALLDVSPCGGVYSLLGQIFLNHLHDNRGFNNRFIIRMLNKLFIRMDKKFFDAEDTLLWMCLAEKRCPPALNTQSRPKIR